MVTVFLFSDIGLLGVGFVCIVEYVGWRIEMDSMIFSCGGVRV